KGEVGAIGVPAVERIVVGPIIRNAIAVIERDGAGAGDVVEERPGAPIVERGYVFADQKGVAGAIGDVGHWQGAVAGRVGDAVGGVEDAVALVKTVAGPAGRSILVDPPAPVVAADTLVVARAHEYAGRKRGKIELRLAVAGGIA